MALEWISFTGQRIDERRDSDKSDQLNNTSCQIVDNVPTKYKSLHFTNSNNSVLAQPMSGRFQIAVIFIRKSLFF